MPTAQPLSSRCARTSVGQLGQRLGERRAHSAASRSACRRGTSIIARTSGIVAGEQRGGRGVGADAAVDQHDDPVGEQQRLGDVVGDHERGQAEPVVQRRDRRGRARRG